MCNKCGHSGTFKTKSTEQPCPHRGPAKLVRRNLSPHSALGSVKRDAGDDARTDTRRASTGFTHSCSQLNDRGHEGVEWP